MKTILVIEDEEPIREGILDIIDASGYIAIGAEDGLIGIELAKQHCPNLIICDLMLPKLNGYEVLSFIRQETTLHGTKFVFLTARADKEDSEKGMQLGADSYLTKPIGLEELLQVIKHYLQD